jgi:exopolysaccharide biosynthesis protein
MSARLGFIHLLTIFILALPVLPGSAQDTIDLYKSSKGSLICWTETKTNPRPLKIYYLRLDLTCKELDLFTLPGDDPDGTGPAESNLTSPEELVTKFKALAAVNANAFAGLPGTENDIRGWYKSRPVDIHGMVVCDGKVVSPVEKDRTAFWIDKKQNPRIGMPEAGDQIWQAVSDWQATLILDDNIIPPPTSTTLHPRSALGFDSSGKWLLLIVVDGRQSGFSEGVSLYELARLLQKKGCSQAINLDGGGSSILLVSDPDGKIRTINSPSGTSQRPVPVMLGIRKKPAI